jgi:1-phosphofructokinase
MSDMPIITVGLSPAWDVTCLGRELDWDTHPKIDRQHVQPAGKALNISRTLAWMGQSSTAAGLWGEQDYPAMHSALTSQARMIRLGFTVVPGSTRYNITILDNARQQELHLRAPNPLDTPENLKRLNTDLCCLVKKDNLCVLAGSLPAPDQSDAVLELLQGCVDLGAQLVMDSHGPLFIRAIHAHLPTIIAPNLLELQEILGRSVTNRPQSLEKACQPLLKHTHKILISRGALGAVLVTQQGSWSGRCRRRKAIHSTVGCGDALLAGLLYGLARGSAPKTALSMAIKAATTHAWALPQQMSWRAASRHVPVEIVSI